MAQARKLTSVTYWNVYKAALPLLLLHALLLYYTYLSGLGHAITSNALPSKDAQPPQIHSEDLRWEASGRLLTARYDHSATLLPNGTVLIAGGMDSNNIPLSSTEVYDPESRTWSSSGSLNLARSQHTATPLSDGRVLIVGNVAIIEAGEIRHERSAELYDPANGSWRLTDKLHEGRWRHTASLLEDGSVLIAGGVSDGADANTVELFDPDSETWQAVKPMRAERVLHTASVLGDGTVLIVGGGAAGSSVTDAGVESYSPAIDDWQFEPNTADPRWLHAAVLLPTGKVVVAGGRASSRQNSTLSSSELFDPADRSWEAIGSLNTPRMALELVALHDGRILAIGGTSEFGSVVHNEAELLDPSSGSWTRATNMIESRVNHTATRLHNGHVLVVGGSIWDPGGSISALNTTELFINSPTPISPVSPHTIHIPYGASTISQR